jgi:predicted permease
MISRSKGNLQLLLPLVILTYVVDSSGKKLIPVYAIIILIALVCNLNFFQYLSTKFLVGQDALRSLYLHVYVLAFGSILFILSSVCND